MLPSLASVNPASPSANSPPVKLYRILNSCAAVISKMAPWPASPPPPATPNKFPLASCTSEMGDDPLGHGLPPHGKRWTMLKLPAGVSAHTRPPSLIPPVFAVPMMLPSLPCIGGKIGHRPSAQFASEQKWCSIVNVPVVVSLKRVPSLNWPPSNVVPYKLPSLACMIPTGFEPSEHEPVEQKICRVVIWPVSVILYTVPQPNPPFNLEPPAEVTP